MPLSGAKCYQSDMSDLAAYFASTEANQLQGGVVTVFALAFAWMILGKLIDLLLELLWMVWIALTVSVTCYLPTVWVYKKSQRLKLNRIFTKKLSINNALNYGKVKIYEPEEEFITGSDSYDTTASLNLTDEYRYKNNNDVRYNLNNINSNKKESDMFTSSENLVNSACYNENKNQIMNKPASPLNNILEGQPNSAINPELTSNINQQQIDDQKTVIKK